MQEFSKNNGIYYKGEVSLICYLKTHANEIRAKSVTYLLRIGSSF